MENKTKVANLSAALISLSIIALSTQEVFAAVELKNPAAGQANISSSEKAYTPLGIHSGGFYIYPTVEVGLRKDDNVFRFPDIAEEADTIFDARAAASINSNWNRHELNAMASIDTARYDEHDSENYEDYVVSTNGVLDIQRGSFLTGKAGYMQQHEDRSSLNSRRGTVDDPAYGVNPTTYDFAYIGAGYDRQPAKIRTLFAVDYETLDYDDIENVFGGIVDNSDRNRARSEAVLRIGYENLPNRRIFIQGEFYSIDYDRQFDNNDRERSSTGYKVTTGMNFDLTDLLVGDVYIGYLEQNYDSTQEGSLSSSLAGFSLKWFPSRLTRVGLHLDRNVEETTLPTSAGYLSTVFGVRVDHELKRNIILFGNADYTNNDFEEDIPGQKENEAITGFGLGAKYMFSRRWFSTAEYRYESRSSDIDIEEFTDNQGLITFGANW